MMFCGYAVCDTRLDENGNRYDAKQHALCQEQSTAMMIKKLLEDAWGMKLVIREVHWELAENYRSLDRREYIR